MDFRLLKTFELVASFMSFNRAAKVLHCTQSTVSAQIKSLEQDLGTPLFERLGRCIVLTSAGETLVHHARRVLSYEHDIRAAVKDVGQTVGLISLRVPQSVADLHLPAILQRFCAEHPRVGFDVSNCGFSHLADELRSGEIDAGFLLSMTIEAADLCSTVVSSEPLAYVASPKSELCKRANLSIVDLAGQTLLVPKHDCAYRMKLQQEIAAAHIDLGAMIELNSVASVVSCVKAGVGVALVPERVVSKDIAARHLSKLRWQAPLAADLHFLRHRDKPLAGAYGAFVASVERHFREQRQA
jgi:DNA-binding transcriptional LysR family regulator